MGSLRYRAALVLLLFMIVMTLIAGCGGNVKTQAPQTPVAKLQPGGTIVYGSLMEPNTLNPLFSDLLATAEVSAMIFNGLAVMNDKGQWLPDLAAELPTTRNGGISPDGLTVTYKLRPGITWHDGKPFTAEDVKFTWRVIMDKKNPVVSREGYDQIVGIDTPDKHTVILRFREVYAPYLTLFPVILPQHILAGEQDLTKAAFNRAPIGTGPFTFKDWVLAESITVEANPSYHHGRPVLDTIIYRVLPDANILLAQVKAGELDIISHIPLSQLEQVKALSGIHTVSTPTMTWEHLDFNMTNPLFQDMRVRQAMMSAIDRQAIVSGPMKNAATVAAADQGPLSWAYNPSIKPAVRDVNRARELLTQAGWSEGGDGIFIKEGRKLSFTITTTKGNKIREATGSLIVQQLREAGIMAEVRLVDVPMFFGDTLKNRRFETAMYAWASGLDPDNYKFWNSKEMPGFINNYGGKNYPGWSNPEVDRLTEQGIRTADWEVRQQIYYRLQELVMQEVPVVPLYYRSTVSAVKAGVTNYSPSPAPAGNLWNTWQWGMVKQEK